MVLINSILLLSLNISPGLTRPDGIDASSTDTSAVTGVHNAVSHSNELNAMAKRDEMLQVAEEDLQDLLEEVKDLEDQVKAMMSSESQQDTATTASDHEEDDCPAEDSDEVSALSPRNANCKTAPTVAAQKMMELSDSEAMVDSEDNSGESASTLPNASSAASSETPTASKTSTSAVSDESIASSTSEDNDTSSTIGALTTTVFTSTKTTESTTTLTRTHTKTVTLSQVPTATEAEDDIDMDIPDDEEESDEEQIDETEQEGEVPSVPFALKTPLPVGVAKTFPNTTAQLLPPVPETVPVTSPLSSTPTPELPAATSDTALETAQLLFELPAANVTARAFAFSGFKTVTTPRLDGSGRTVQ